MASAVGRVLSIGAVLLAIPTACVGALALYGKALSESESGAGTLISPTEARARVEQARARFAAMTPAEHLAAARAALAAGYDPVTDTGGSFRSFEHHADAIPAGTPEFEAVRPLRDVPRVRWDKLLVIAGGRVVQHAREHAFPAGGSVAQQRAARTALALDVDQLSGRGLGCVHVADEADTSLRFDQANCWPGMLRVVAPDDARAALRSYGFRRVRCNNGNAAIDL
ncbi:MAG: hypothetical protein JWM10_785 [Myxococcaceae bacterium]|nr:hypothetical protein [Myxococcaceae bacterium]